MRAGGQKQAEVYLLDGEILRPDASWCEAVCVENGERRVGVKKRRERSSKPDNKREVRRGCREESITLVTPCSHKDLILLYAYSSLGLEY